MLSTVWAVCLHLVYKAVQRVRGGAVEVQAGIHIGFVELLLLLALRAIKSRPLPQHFLLNNRPAILALLSFPPIHKQ